jgi:hypothetical protein
VEAAVKRWKWTRKRYERARRLFRIMNAMRGYYRQGKPPAIVERYLKLMEPVKDQCDHMDPNDGGYYRHLGWRLQWFKRKKHGLEEDDEMPF